MLLIFLLQLRPSAAGMLDHINNYMNIECFKCGKPKQIDAQLLLDDFFYHKWVSESFSIIIVSEKIAYLKTFYF